jgi:hypothetical protein
MAFIGTVALMLRGRKRLPLSTQPEALSSTTTPITSDEPFAPFRPPPISVKQPVPLPPRPQRLSVAGLIVGVVLCGLGLMLIQEAAPDIAELLFTAMLIAGMIAIVFALPRERGLATIKAKFARPAAFIARQRVTLSSGLACISGGLIALCAGTIADSNPLSPLSTPLVGLLMCGVVLFISALALSRISFATRPVRLAPAYFQSGCLNKVALSSGLFLLLLLAEINGKLTKSDLLGCSKKITVRLDISNSADEACLIPTEYHLETDFSGGGGTLRPYKWTI